MNPPLCPLSGQGNPSTTPDPLRSCEGEIFPRVKCTSCGCEWLQPAPTEAQLSKAYGTDYYGEGESKFTGPVESVIRRFRGGRARAAARILGSSPGKVLDVGCGNGGFLASLAPLGPYEIHGFELPGPAADRARRIPGLILHEGPFSMAELPPASFRLITLFVVIEHLPHPGRFLGEAARLLEPGGNLRLSLPNVASWQAAWSGQGWLHWDPPRHLWLAPPESLAQAAQRQGLQLVRESHFSLEQNPFGLLQGLLNHLFPRDRLYNWLKRRSPGKSQARTPWLDLLAAALLAAPCLLLSLAETALRRGGTMELDFKRVPSPHLPPKPNTESLQAHVSR